MSSAAKPVPWPRLGRPDARVLLGDDPVCFDTMVLTALVRANRTQILVESMRSRARMPRRVCGELRGHAEDNPEILKVTESAGFGQCLSLDRDAAQRASDQQRAWHSAAAIEANAKLDRGEAECLELCQANGWPLLSHDKRARTTGHDRGIVVLGVPDLLMLLVAEGRLLDENAWLVYGRVLATGLRPAKGWPLSADARESFLRCCDVMSGPAGRSPRTRPAAGSRRRWG